MKKIWSITRVELAQLFYSPIAWIIIVIFGFEVYQTFSASFADLAGQLDMYGALKNVTYELFSSRNGLFPSICSNLYLYIPLLTMGLMSRDLSSGSVKLLYSSPVTSSQIILGKFLSMMIFSAIMLSLVLPTIIFAGVKVPYLDYGLVFTGLLGVFMLFWAYVAIGLFMSCLTSYQIVAALLTFGTFTLLNQLGTMGQRITFLRDITYWASISGRTEQFISGLISSEDVIYFLLIIGLFLSFCIFLFQYRRNNRKGQAALKYVGSILGVLMVGYLSSRPVALMYHDSTSTKINTITRNSRNVLEEIDGPMKITTYVNLADFSAWLASPVHVNSDIKSFKSYLRFKPDMKMDYVYYYDEPYCNFNYGQPDAVPAKETAEKMAKSYGIPFKNVLTPEQIRERVDLQPEMNSIVKVLEDQDGHQAFLRTFDDMIKVPQEQEIATAMKCLVHPSVRVGFLSGHGERSITSKGDEDYYTFISCIKERKAIINKGFSPVTINLAEGDSLSGIDILVISDMRRPMDAAEERQVLDYLDRGGNLMLAVEPDWVASSRVLLDYLDVFTFDGTIVQKSKDLAPTLIPTHVAPASKDLSYAFVSMSTVTMPGAMSIEYKMNSEWDAWPLTFTGSNCWNETEVTDFHRLDDSSELVANLKAQEFKKRHTTGLGLSRTVDGKEQHVVVLGDADCLSNIEMTVKRKSLMNHNKFFFNGVFNWLSNDEMPVDVRRKSSKDVEILLTPSEASMWALLFKWLIPVLLAIVGSALVFIRSRR